MLIHIAIDYFYQGVSSQYHNYQTQSISWMMTTDISFPPTSYPQRMFGLHQGAIASGFLPALDVQNHTEFRWNRAAHLLCDSAPNKRGFEFGRDHLGLNGASVVSIYKNTQVRSLGFDSKK
jgi:hypothetical protein